MTSVYATRTANLKFLAKHHGGQSQLAVKLGFTKAWLSQLIGKTTHCEVSEKTARKIEAVLSVEPGWLDREHAAADERTLIESPRKVRRRQNLERLLVEF